MDTRELATLLQSRWRGRKTRKNYNIQQLPSTKLTGEQTYIVGNDPKIIISPEHQCIDKRIAMIATSGLRGLDLICQLGNQKSTPKLIIIDNSSHVITFWRKLRDMIKEDKHHEEHELIEKFKLFLEQHKPLYRSLEPDVFAPFHKSDLEYENQDPVLFFSKLVENYGAQYVSDIIKKSTILGQSWTDQTLFASIKNILKLNEIEITYTYPSNIPHCIDRESASLIFKNIEQLAPALSIFTNFCEIHSRPEKVILTNQSSADDLKTIVFSAENSVSWSDISHRLNSKRHPEPY